MKKLSVLFAILFVCVTANTFSQSFTFVRTSPVVVDTTLYPVMDIWSLGMVHINGSSPITLHCVFTNINVPQGWDSAGWCSWDICYGNGNRIDDIVVSPGDHELHVYFNPNNHLGMQTSSLTISNGSTSVTQQFATRTNPIGIQQISTIVKEFSLAQNYPNPFNPTTKINFNIPKAEFTFLRVYDILGREVKTLVAEHLSAGEYQVDFDASNLSSGMYYYSLRSGDNVTVKKMVLVK